MKKKIFHIQQCLVLGLILAVCTACPEFKSVRISQNVYKGDTVKLEVWVDIKDRKRGSTGFYIHVPFEWEIIQDSAWIEGCGTPMKFISEYDNYYSHEKTYYVSVNDTFLTNELYSVFTLVNHNDKVSTDTLSVEMYDYDWFYAAKSFVVNTHDNARVPRNLKVENGQAEWRPPANPNGIENYTIFANGNELVTTSDTRVNLPVSDGIYRYSVAANYSNSTIEFSADTLYRHYGDRLYVSNLGNDQNNGTALYPLKSVSSALEWIEEDYLLSEEKQIILRPGTYELESWDLNTPSEKSLRGNLSIKGEHPSNTVLVGNGKKGLGGISLQAGVSMENISFKNFSTAISLYNRNWGNPVELMLENVWIQESDTAVYFRGTQINLKNVLLNSREFGIYNAENFILDVENSTIVNSTHGIYYNYHYPGSGEIKIRNSIFHNNVNDIYSFNGGAEIVEDLETNLEISHNIIQEDWHNFGLENIQEDPDFSEDAEFPFTLSDFSPAIDAGIDSAQYNDVEDLSFRGMAAFPAMGTIRNDLGIYGGGGREYLVTGIETPNLVNYTIYPNPTHDYIRVQVENPLKLSKLKLVDLGGKTVINQYQKSRDVLDIRNIPAGVYLLQFTYEDIQITERVIKSGQ